MSATPAGASYDAAKWVMERFGNAFPIDSPELPRCAGFHGPNNPCDGTRGKHPAAKWASQTATDSEGLSRYFMRMTRNVGLACGPAGLLVVDEDEPGAFAAYAASIGEAIPQTFRVRTGRGEHFYFRQDGSLTNTDGRLKDHKIDVRGKGGMVVAPGSLHASGTVYTAVDPDAVVAEIPAWLVDTLRSVSGQSTAGSLDPFGQRTPTPRSGPIAAGERHTVLHRYASSLRARNIDKDEAEVLMTARWAQAEQPAGDPYTLEAALAQVEYAWAHYEPGSSLTRGDDWGDLVDLTTTAVQVGPEPPMTVDDTGVTLTDRVLARYPVVDWGEAFAKDRSEPDWLCEPLLEVGRVVAIFSPPKVGKSLLTLDIVAGIACGRPVLGNPARQPVSVLYVDMENTIDDIVERLTDLGYGPEEITARLKYLSFPDLPPLDTATGGRHLLAVAEAYGSRLVVIDTVSRVIEGDEDSSDTFRHLYRHSILPLKKAGLAVLRLDHSGKDLTRGQRGSSAKADDVDAVWSLVHRTGTKFDLRRTHSRTNHGADHVEVIRHSDPLRHEASNVGTPSESLTLVAELDRLEVAQDAGRNVAREALKAAGLKASTAVLADALRHRQGRPDLSGTPRTGPETVEAPRSAKAVRLAADSTRETRSNTCPGQVADSSDSEPQSNTADLSDQVHPVGMDRSAGTAPDKGQPSLLDIKLGDLRPCARRCGELVHRYGEHSTGPVCATCLGLVAA